MDQGPVTHGKSAKYTIRFDPPKDRNQTPDFQHYLDQLRDAVDEHIQHNDALKEQLAYMDKPRFFMIKWAFSSPAIVFKLLIK